MAETLPTVNVSEPYAQSKAGVGLSIGGGLLGSIIGAGASLYSQHMANEANKKLAEQANQWSLEQWNRENAYNTPEAQRKRLEDAGFNPNLVFAQGNLVNESAQSPAVTSAAGAMRGVRFGSPLDPVSIAQVQNIAADSELKRAQATNLTSQTRINNLDADLKSMTNDVFTQAYESGLVEDAFKAGLGNEITDYQGSRLDLFSAAWDLAVATGYEVKDLYALGQSDVTSIPDINKTAFNKARSVFTTSQDAQIMSNEAARAIAEYNKLKREKDVDIYSFLKDRAENGSKFEKIGATVALIALFIMENHLSMPSIGFNISGGTQKTSYHTTSVSNNSSTAGNTIINRH